jgi:hypothetical protein
MIWNANDLLLVAGAIINVAVGLAVLYVNLLFIISYTRLYPTLSNRFKVLLFQFQRKAISRLI